MKFSDTPPEFVTTRDAYIKERWEQLAELQQIWSERVIRYLMLVNAGGAVAVLAFMGAIASKGDRYPIWASGMLVLFVLGLIAVGVLQIYSQHRHDWLYLQWRNGVTDFHEDKTTWFSMTSDDIKRSSRPIPFYVLVHLSFAMFLLASAVGAWNLLFCK